MGDPTSEKTAADVTRANLWLDSAAPLNMLRRQFDYSADEIDELCQKLTGGRLSKSVQSRFSTKQKDAPKSLPGIPEVAIHVMAATETGIAERALLTEFKVRQASHQFLHARSDENKAKLLHQLGVTQREIASLRRLLKNLRPVQEGDTERALDIAALDYVEGQVRIHKGRLLSSEQAAEKLHEFEAGLAWMLAVMLRLSHAVRAGERNAERIDLLLAVNAGLNAFFAAYELDDLGKDETLQKARDVAHKLATPLFLRAAQASASWQHDPRVAFNIASAAGLVRQHAAAAKSLKLAAQLDGHQGKIYDWNPRWMTGTIDQSSELAEAIDILNREGE